MKKHVKKHVIRISDEELKQLEWVIQEYIKSCRRTQASLDKASRGLQELHEELSASNKRALERWAQWA